MKRILTLAAVAVFSLALAQTSSAQTANALGQSQAASNSQSGSLSGAQSNNNINFGSAPANTTADIKNVPSVYAPSIGGGGHPCLAGGSAGLSVLGGGLSGGKSDLEVVCMLAWLGQNEAAIRALVNKSSRACQAIENVGYYMVPMGNGKTKAVSFKCSDKTVKGGIFTTTAVAVGQGKPSTRVSTRNAPAAAPPAALYNKCAMEGDKVKIKYTNAGRADKAAAGRACLASLGY